MISRRSSLVYGTLLAIWLLLIAWQIGEHISVQRAAQETLIHHARDVSNSLAMLMRSARFFGVITRTRLDSFLNDLVKQGDVLSVKLLNADNEEVASAGPPIDPPAKGSPLGAEYWDKQSHTVMLMNLVDLGTNIVISTGELFRPPGRPGTNQNSSAPLPPPTNVIIGVSSLLSNNSPVVSTNELTGNTNRVESQRRDRRRGPFRGTNDLGSFERPPWMSPSDYSDLIQKKGVHGFMIKLSTQSLVPIIRQDLWVRLLIGFLATLAVCGYGIAWRSFGNTSELQIRLARASEINSHLKELNLAAAGLAHETRNPLNIIRGLAQMISKQPDANEEIRGKLRNIINEADRVAAQLNEFINYSRPRELRRVPTQLHSVVAEVVQALNYDIEEKKVTIEQQTERLVVEADEQLLRQALFNLVLNAIQAVPEGGRILIRGAKVNGSAAVLEISDNGPGVAPENRREIFKPYFTTQSTGTGLGLAVVQQIVSAHGWEIECLSNEPQGALFRLSRLKRIVKG